MCCKGVNTATALDCITVPSNKNKCSYELFYRKTPCNIGSLHTFGEIAVTKGPTNISTKLYLCRRVCMFLRYSEDHTQNVYRGLDLNMKKVVYSQDVQWMDIMYGEHMGIKHKIPIN